MRFGVALSGEPRGAARQARVLEDLDFDTAWFPDVPLLGSGDPYVSMTLAVTATERLRVGTWISPAGVRPAPMFLTPFATLNRLAPGRVRMGWGSGSFTQYLLGLPPLKVAQLSQELTVIRDLRDRGEAEFRGTAIQMSTPEHPCLDFTGLPLEVAASGPRTAELAGRIGDGVMTGSDIRPEKLSLLRRAAITGAEELGRPTDFPYTVDVGALCVTRPGETLQSPRIRSLVQPIVTLFFDLRLMLGTDPEELPSPVRDDYVKFRAWAFDRFGDDPQEAHRGLWKHGLSRNPEHDQFISDASIHACTLTGTVGDVSERLREIQSVGTTDLIVTPAMEQPEVTADALADLMEVRERLSR